MNQEMKHLYEGLSTEKKQQLKVTFEQSPKMLQYIHLLDKQGFVSTPKAISIIYQEEQEKIQDKVLINRFYKLRSKLHLHLLDQMKQHPNSQTKEEKELAFLRLLVIKNEHAYALKKLKVLEQKCWEDNLFELLPEVIELINSALHGHQPNNIEAITTYFQKAELANELLYNLQKFKNYIVSFRTTYEIESCIPDFVEVYQTTINKMRRKATSLKDYPRFSLIYHYVAFSIGCQIGPNTAFIGNILVRHINKLKKLLADHPNMPMDVYIPNHRVFNLDFIYHQEAMLWYHKDKSKKSYQCLLKSKQLRQDHPEVYIKTFNGTLHNAILCCLGAKQYNMAFDYLEEIKEFQLTNTSTYADIPYFVYEAIIYIGCFPHKKHPSPIQLIEQLGIYTKQMSASSAWIYDVVGSFCLLYQQLEQSKYFLEQPALVEYYKIYVQCDLYSLDVLKLVMAKDALGLKKLIQKIVALKKQTTHKGILMHLNDLKKLAEQF